MEKRSAALALRLLVVAGMALTNPLVRAESVVFTVTLLPSNQVPPITNAEQSASGTGIFTLNLTRDGSNNITAADVQFNVTLSNFPANTVLTATHIHQEVAGNNGGVVIDSGLSSLTLATGSGSFTRSGIAVSTALAAAILAGPTGFYLNVHSTLNPGGAVRGQLPACPTITLAPSTLSGISAGVPYTQAFTASGGTGSYTFSVTSGALPGGLSLSSGGVLSGTPTAPGLFSFTVRATTSSSCAGSQSYSLGVGAVITTVPTLSEWGLILLTGLLVLFGFLNLRKSGGVRPGQ